MSNPQAGPARPLKSTVSALNPALPGPPMRTAQQQPQQMHQPQPHYHQQQPQQIQRPMSNNPSPQPVSPHGNTGSGGAAAQYLRQGSGGSTTAASAAYALQAAQSQSATTAYVNNVQQQSGLKRSPSVPSMPQSQQQSSQQSQQQEQRRQPNEAARATTQQQQQQYQRQMSHSQLQSQGQSYAQSPPPVSTQQQRGLPAGIPIPTSSTATTYSRVTSSNPVGQAGPGDRLPNWGPTGVLFPPPGLMTSTPEPKGLAALYHRPTAPAVPVVPFAPPPHKAQNLCEVRDTHHAWTRTQRTGACVLSGHYWMSVRVYRIPNSSSCTRPCGPLASIPFTMASSGLQ